MQIFGDRSFGSMQLIFKATTGKKGQKHTIAYRIHGISIKSRQQ